MTRGGLLIFTIERSNGSLHGGAAGRLNDVRVLILTERNSYLLEIAYVVMGEKIDLILPRS